MKSASDIMIWSLSKGHHFKVYGLLPRDLPGCAWVPCVLDFAQCVAKGGYAMLTNLFCVH